MKSELDEFIFYHLLIESILYRDRELMIFLQQGAVATEKEDISIGGQVAIEGVRKIEVLDESLGFVVHFDDVVLYQVIEESADTSDNDEFESKGNISKFKNSALLEFAKEKTILFDVSPGEICHFRVITGDEWIHVLCRGEPTIVRKSEWGSYRENA